MYLIVSLVGCLLIALTVVLWLSSEYHRTILLLYIYNENYIHNKIGYFLETKLQKCTWKLCWTSCNLFLESVYKTYPQNEPWCHDFL